MADVIQIQDFAKVEIRMGTVIKAEVPEGSKSVLQLTVDFGGEGIKTIFSGIKNWYGPEDVEGKQLPFVLNLEPKQIGNMGVSQGMLVAAAPVAQDGQKEAVLLLPDKKVPEGTQVI